MKSTYLFNLKPVEAEYPSSGVVSGGEVIRNLLPDQYQFYSVWREGEGDKPDHLVQHGDLFSLRERLCFYSVPPCHGA